MNIRAVQSLTKDAVQNIINKIIPFSLNRFRVLRTTGGKNG